MQLRFEDVYSVFQVDSLVSHLVQRESGPGHPTIDISGPKCLELYQRLCPDGSWARTFAVSLVGAMGLRGQKGWYSTKLSLTWKVSVTKSSQPYFLLAASKPRTDGTDFTLLLTPTTKENPVDLEVFQKRMEKYPNGTLIPNLATQVQQMLPTPTRFDYNSARTPEKWEEDKAKYAAKGINLQNPLKQHARLGMLPTPTTKNVSGGAVQVNANGKRQNKGGTEFSAQLHDLAKSQMLPTPTATDFKGAYPPTSIDNNPARKSLLRNVYHMDQTQGYDSKDSQLSPRFVAEMMGFPPNWTELPFQNGEGKASSVTGTQS